ncbi:EpsG family protein [Treponema sp.]|uniref:EpsG family protein n=1 Tax=Treponema sp. TaxID=166 RepID=UPI0025FD74FD|nr:EpsG family protein [Treponema sp.]MBR4320883.1 EpsG family protein [Treponema sp.]
MNSIFYCFPYIIIFIIITIFSVPLVNNRNPNASIINFGQYFAITFILILFIGLRGFIYTDWKTYYPYYNSLPSLFDGKNALLTTITKGKYSVYEKGWLLFSILIKTFSSNYFVFQNLQFCIDLFILLLFFKTYIPDHIFLGVVFFYVFNGVIGLGLEINFLRNAKALMLFLISIQYIQKKKIILYFLLNIFGILFHTSSVLYLPLYFILNRRFSKKIYLYIFVIGNFIYLLQIRWVSVILLSVSKYLGSNIEYILYRYITSSKWSVSYGISIGYLERFFTFILVMHFSNRLYKKSFNIIFINCLYLYILSYLYLSEMRILTDRIPLLFAFGYWIIYPQIYVFFKKDKKIIFLSFLIFYSVLKIMSGHSTILNMYDNALYLKYSYEQRVQFRNQYFRSFE